MASHREDDAEVVLTSQGETANFSGIEIWTRQLRRSGDPISDEELAFFEKRIRPLLVEQMLRMSQR